MYIYYILFIIIVIIIIIIIIFIILIIIIISIIITITIINLHLRSIISIFSDWVLFLIYSNLFGIKDFIVVVENPWHHLGPALTMDKQLVDNTDSDYFNLLFWGRFQFIPFKLITICHYTLVRIKVDMLMKSTKLWFHLPSNCRICMPLGASNRNPIWTLSKTFCIAKSLVTHAILESSIDLSIQL
jgi:hypothetical protein